MTIMALADEEDRAAGDQLAWLRDVSPTCRNPSGDLLEHFGFAAFPINGQCGYSVLPQPFHCKSVRACDVE